MEKGWQEKSEKDNSCTSYQGCNYTNVVKFKTNEHVVASENKYVYNYLIIFW